MTLPAQRNLKIAGGRPLSLNNIGLFSREKNMKIMLSYLFFVLAAMSVVVGPALAQTTAGVRETITDPTGLVVPSAKVTITNVDTQLMQMTTTSSEGIYAFTLLPSEPTNCSWKQPGSKLSNSPVLLYPLTKCWDST